MFKKLALIACIGLVGCSSEMNVDNSYPVDCTAIYKTRQGAANEKRQAIIHIQKVRIDRFGRRFVQPTPNLTLKFYGRWQAEDLFSDYRCVGKDYGLRR